MRVSLPQKVFSVFFPLTAMTLLLGVTIYFGMTSLRDSSEQISLLKDFQLVIKQLEVSQAQISNQIDSFDLQKFEREIKTAKKLAGQIAAFDRFIPSDLRKKLQQLSARIENFHRAFLELHQKYLADKNFLETNFNLHVQINERLHVAASVRPSNAHDAVGQLLPLQTRVYHDRDASQIPQMKKVYKDLQNMTSDKKLLKMVREFVSNVEENFLNSLAIKNRGKFLSDTAHHFFTLSDETIAALSKENLKKQSRLIQSIIAIILITIFLSFFLWFLSYSYFKRFLATQKKAIESIKNENYDYEMPRAPEDEIGDLTITMKHLALSLKESRIQIQQSKEKYQELVENLADWIWEIDAQGHYIYSSPASESILGFLPEEIIGKTPFDFAVSDTEQGQKDRTLFVKILKSQISFQGLETTSIHKEGQQVILETSGIPIISQTGDFQGFRGISRNITKRKEAESEKALLEEQLQQSQKMESIGRLAGGVAHDFNNILSAINGYSELLLLDLDENDPTRESIENILESGQKAARLTQQLLAFSRRQIIKPVILDLNQEISVTRKMIARILGEDIEISIFAAKDLWPVRTDRSQIEQIIMNLAVNARDAMPQGGMLTIETANVKLDKDYVSSYFSLSPGDYVTLTVTDTGSGITKDIQQNIFEPFFTTKDQNKGTGLGLATVYGIIRQNGGDIHVYSEINKGTSFKIYLPRAEESNIADAVSTSKAPDDLHHGTETILLVEDDASVRDLAESILSKLGYTVLKAGTGSEALQICLDYQGRIDLLLTDVVMPKMSGSELADEVKKNSPDTKILFMSGYTENSIVHHGVLKKGINFLHKPIIPNNLSLAVRTLLDS
ncbi:MAG: response regulator [Desulfobulbaceae bacterium]|nr:response regulator [Desulfobulbaceae bacterium]